MAVPVTVTGVVCRRGSPLFTPGTGVNTADTTLILLMVTVCLQRPSGNMRAGREQLLHIAGGIQLTAQRPCMGITGKNEPSVYSTSNPWGSSRTKPHQLKVLPLIHGDSMICTGMSGNGVQTLTMNIQSIRIILDLTS